MTYNTERGKLEMSEYGRIVQRMVEYVCTIEDDVKRNEQANVLIELMGQLNPHLRNVEEFRHKLWDHIIIMSDFKLKVNSPYPTPERETFFEKPKPLPYPQSNIPEKHYGKNVLAMIEKAKAMDDPEKKAGFTEVIGNYMKLVHNNWSQENVNNEVIYSDIERISEGELKLAEDSNLDLLAKVTRQPQQQQGGGKKKFQNKQGNRNKNFKKKQFQNRQQ
ncbi:MAG: DUF4290 domain-containing protein [Chitinophagales bacterium]|nr:DUF4290 domain-containing protein [Chitinophagales bacterium]